MNTETNASKNDNYSADQEAIIRNFKGTGPDGKLNFEDAKTIGELPEMAVNGEPRKARSVAAKISNMKLPYAKRENARKDGSPVESKAVLVSQIAEAAGVTFEGLDKAARGDLVMLRDVIFALRGIAEAEAIAA